MIIRKLAVQDFRVFAGRHEFDLEPRKKYSKHAPIVLFGGLNGAGKTSILTAVQVALYGRPGLGLGTSKKDYDTFLKESIHRFPAGLVKKNAAKIELAFSFANMGVVNEYKIIRGWSVEGPKVTESLKILENDKEMRDMDYEQAQAFLYELIPIGVSDLFFFDGEKIKDLAEDKTGKVLADAIRKLLGLDLIQRLSADLTLLLRDKEKQHGDQSVQKLIKKKEYELETTLKSAEDTLTEFEATRCGYVELTSEIDRFNAELESAGGAWATSQSSLLEEHSEKHAKRTFAENNVRDTLGDTYPLSLMGNYLENLSERLVKEGEASGQIEAFSLVKLHADDLAQSIADSTGNQKKDVKKAITQWRRQVEKKTDIKEIRHDLSASQRERLLHQIETGLQSGKELHTKVQHLSELSSDLEQIGIALSRAPDERALKDQFDQMKSLTNQHSEMRLKLLGLKEERRKHLSHAIGVARELKKLHDNLKADDLKDRVAKLSHAAKEMVNEFAELVTAERVKQLETEFMQSYTRLARKEDHHIHASICSKSFDVVLSDDSGQEINKNELSAGEKQIYAIAILEALAKTSGRNLPIIIDTPLGRLDSEHREKLREHYFPHASQQVIILSTDTEVDQDFYIQLEKSISHSYLLEFDNDEKSTSVDKGYFWRKEKAA